MPTKPILAFTLIVGSAVALTACKRHDQPVAAANAAAAGATAPATAAAPAPAASAVAAAPMPAAPAAAAPAPAASQAGSASFDINRIAVTQAALPPFPYLDWPDSLPAGSRNIRTQEFDRAYFIVGKEVRPVEGHVEQRYFVNDVAKLSKLAAERNYESVLKALGAVQVNTVEPDSPEIDGHNIDGLQDKLYVLNGGSYRAYLIRTPEKNIWLSLSVSEGHTQIMAVDEQAMRQSVHLTSVTPGSPALPH